MFVSVFEIFKVGIGPSSSHTVGPMKAARWFVLRLKEHELLARVARVQVYLYGSLAATGRGHGTHTAVQLGLLGHAPDTVDTQQTPAMIDEITQSESLSLLGEYVIRFIEAEDVFYLKREVLPFHTNGMRFIALDEMGQLLLEKTYYSVGGGFVLGEDEIGQPALVEQSVAVPFPFNSAAELVKLCEAQSCSMADLIIKNETAPSLGKTRLQVEQAILAIWQVMNGSIDRGCAPSQIDQVLPGQLRIPKRAARLYQQLTQQMNSDHASSPYDSFLMMEWVNVFAMAVNEENACGGRVVTAPTNGAAGVIPAVLAYFMRFTPGANNQHVIEFLLTAAAVGALYKNNASISGAEVGCQGEVGVACSMAAAALCAVMGGSVRQVENAAEIGMEHNLGLTCDPVGGRVQVPCIERNAMGAVKAINAARLALRGDGKHVVSLDQVIKTMRETGADMQSKYKETSRGGLAVNVVEC